MTESKRYRIKARDKSIGLESDLSWHPLFRDRAEAEAWANAFLEALRAGRIDLLNGGTVEIVVVEDDR
jgi:hypothetical protein